MLNPASLTHVEEMIRVAVAPVFLLTGLAGLLSVISGRLARVVDRARVLGGKSNGELSADQQAETRRIPRRIKLINLSILFAAMSTLAVCLVIVLLFVSSLVDLNIGISVAVAFIVAMMLLMGALVSLIAEVRLALTSFYVPTDTLLPALSARAVSP